MTKQEEIPVLFRDKEIDPEILDLVKALNAQKIYTVSSCSGHGKEYGYIWLQDGRILVILPDRTTKDEVCLKLAI